MVDFRGGIQIGATTIRPGDRIFDDRERAVVVPREIAGTVLRRAFDKAAGEKRVFAAIRGGKGVRETWARFGRR